jgi:signal transduction histidine kinase
MPGAYALIGLTAVIGALAAALTFAVLRFSGVSHRLRQDVRQDASGQALTAALEQAVARLQAQERATAARAEASERLSSEIMSSLTAGLLVVGLDGEVRILNPAGRRLLNVSEVAPRENYRQMIGEPALSQVIDECLTTRGTIVRRTIRLPETREGASHLGVTVSPLFGDAAELHGAICLFTDLTAVHELEERLRLKESLATVGELTAGMAHEFRNGLATIHGYSKLMDLNALPDAYRAYLEGIRSEVESLTQIVTNFLNFARPAQLTLSRVDLRMVCERAADELRGDVQSLGGEIAIRGEFGTVDGDEVLLRQAFSNLLRNAVEACAAGARSTPTVIVSSDLDSVHNMSVVSVDDNGPGIPPDARDRVFRPFFTSKRSGTGLGLALVQKIVVFHNGRISVGSSPLGGASLQISLPNAERPLAVSTTT